MDHLLLGPADEVSVSRLPRKLIERIVGRERIWKQEAPQSVVGVVFPHVRCGRQQQHMLGRPVQCPRLAVGSGTGDSFRQFIAVRFPYPEIRLTICRQLMGLVKDNQIVRLCCRLLEATKQSVPS